MSTASSDAAASSLLWEMDSLPGQAVVPLLYPSMENSSAVMGFELEDVLREESSVESVDLGVSERLMEESIGEAARAAHVVGYEAGVADERAAYEVQIAEQRERIATVLTGFAREKSAYFSAMESEIVRLALAVAERVLHRAVEEDPAALVNVVRAVLERVQERSGCVLRVCAEDVGTWRACTPRLPEEVELRADESLGVGECALETRLGVAEMNVRAQMEEMEKTLLGNRSSAA